MKISSNVFSPSQRVKDEIEAQGYKGLDVRVMVVGLTAEGHVKVRADKAKNYGSIGMGSMPLLNPWTQLLGGMSVNFSIINNEIARGHASLQAGSKDPNDWLHALQKTADALGGLGLKIGRPTASTNKFDGTKLTLGVSNLHVEVGDFIDAHFNLSVENMGPPKIDATADINIADINIKGMAKGQLKLANDTGKLVGQVSLAINYKDFSGDGNVTYKPDGSVDVTGKVAYNANKLSGEIQFVATDPQAAENFTKNAIAAAGGEKNIQEAAPPAPVPPPKAGQKKRALAATGQLAFNLTDWFAGTVNVVVDSKGAVTVIGKIAPPAEIRLFDQRDWDNELFKFEAKAYYGIPVVGDLNLFANISLHAITKLGPAKIYNIEILGTYSTDPERQKSIQISGSINISAYGGLRLRAEGGAGVEILEHDLKFGIGLNADVGVQAYADARPTIGYRDPGVFYISGTLELVAQPVLGLGGDFFIAVETPWWSPLSDHKWTWPLFSKEWPLTNPIGISAAVKDYELGSKKVPEIALKPPEFDPSKFMTSMVDDTLPNKSGGAGAGQGTFKEDGTVMKPIVPPKKPAPKVAETKPPKKSAPLKTGKSASPDPKAAKDQQSGKILASAAKHLAALKAKKALTRSELDQELAKIKTQVSGIDFGVQLKRDKWVVTPQGGGKTGRAIELNALGSDIELVERSVKFASEKHSLRIQVIRAQSLVLMASDAFTELTDELILLRRKYLGQHPPAGRLIAGRHSEAAAAMDERLRAISAKKHALERRTTAEQDVTKRVRIEADGLAELERDIEQMGDYLVSTFGKSFGKGGTVEAGDTIYYTKADRGYQVLDVGRVQAGELGIFAQPLVGGDTLFLKYIDYAKEWLIPSAKQPPPWGGFRGGQGSQERKSINARRGINLGGTAASYDPPGLGGKWNRRGHLVGQQFGGKGDQTNIVAMTEAANHTNEGIVSIENDARNHMKGGAVITYRARPEYGAKNYVVSPPDAVLVEVDEIWPNPTPVKFRKPVKNV
ncbi:MAG: DNA/RNA non-specific endonuclease [Deltaproteobacteria bacterium]|nr:DNA/RNA non-specific endonuclease [Deltaproteobacteria bacterium]